MTGRKLSYNLIFGLFSIIAVILLLPILRSITSGSASFYVSWLEALSIVTLLMYGLDKLLAVQFAINARVPETILHILALAGGFPGGWLGMFLFRHKTNGKKHPLFKPILILSTVIHGLLFYFLIL